jgi:hypothetical protein
MARFTTTRADGTIEVRDAPGCTGGADGHAVHWRWVLGMITHHHPGERCRVLWIDDDGWVVLDRRGEEVLRWYHRPAELRAAVEASDGPATLHAGQLLMVPRPEQGHLAFPLGEVASRCDRPRGEDRLRAAVLAAIVD